MDNEFMALKEIAMKLAHDTTISDFVRYGHVACALLTDKKNVYTGLSMNAKCALGSCAEHAAILDMLKAGETKIEKIVSASENAVVPACGRCRELIRQINPDNENTKVLINDTEYKKIKELLPDMWQMDKI